MRPTRSASPEALVYRDTEQLATATAARLLVALGDAQRRRGEASVVLTGGRTGEAVLQAVRSSPALGTVDFSRLRVFWGDERFVPAGDPQRNELLARRALLDHVPVLPERIYPMAADGGAFGHDLDAAARGYAAQLRALDPQVGVPAFDVCLLGVGDEGHTASLFPNSEAVLQEEATVVGVPECPKPPPRRLSLTLPAIRASRQVWVVTAGEGKAEAVAQAMHEPFPTQLPAAGARGRQATLWLVDEAAWSPAGKQQR